MRPKGRTTTNQRDGAAHTIPKAIYAMLGALALMATLLAGCGSGGTPSSVAQPTATATPKPPVVYVALGASDAVGVGASDPAHTAYIPIIISRLPKNSYALNLGISGETLHKALTDELPYAIQAQPTLMTVWLVGNDFRDCVPLQQYGADLNTLLTQLQTKTHAKVFVANAPDMSMLPAIKQQAAEQGGFCGVPDSQAAIRGLVTQWNSVIDASVAQHGDVLVDLFNTPLTLHPDYIYSDGFHPSDKGYLALANLFWSEITAHDAVPKA